MTSKLHLYLLSFVINSSLLLKFRFAFCHYFIQNKLLFFALTFLIVDPWQSCVCFIRSGVTLCTLFMVLSLDRMCQRGLHAVLWSHIGTLMHRLAAEPCSTARLLFPFRCPSGTILLTPFSMVWDWRVSREGPMLLYWPKLLYPYYNLLLSFPFSSFCL